MEHQVPPALHEKTPTTNEGLTWRANSLTSDKKPLPYTWNPSWFQTRPLLGILSLGVAIGCMAASLVVLFISNGKPVETSFWVVQPTVYLAIAASLGAFAVRFAMTQAIPVAWWYRALRGRSIRELHSQWEASQGPMSAIMRFPNAPWISTTSLLLVLMLVDGAFLQRATTIVSTTRTDATSLNFNLIPELPRGFSGSVADSEIKSLPIAAAGFSGWLHNHSIPLPIEGCGPSSTCSATIQAPGLAQLHCTEKVWPITQAMWTSSNATWGSYHFVTNTETYLNYPYNASLTVNPAFTVQIELTPSTVETHDPETLVVGAEFLQINEEGEGQFTSRKCQHVPAILEYDVEFHDGTLILPSDTSSSRVVAVANNTREYDVANPDPQPQTLTYFFVSYFSYSQVNATIVYQGRAPQNPSGDKNWAFNPLSLNAYAMEFMNDKKEGVWFVDPMNAIVSSFNNMMVRGAANFTNQGLFASAPHRFDHGIEQHQSVPGKETTTLNVFRTEFSWFAAAAIIYLIVILAILPLFWGFWLFPKNCSLSPFEVALAFHSPLFPGVNSAAGVGGIVENLGDVKIAYGVVDDYTQSGDGDSRMSVTRLAFADHRNIRMPMSGTEIFV